MFLNVDKCMYISFCHKHYPLLLNYHINGTALEKIDCTKDHGVTLDSKLNFHSHMDTVILKANCMLGFLKRWTKDFTDPYVLKTLYISFVRSTVEYAAVVWNPYYSVHINRIEGIQRNFLRYALRKLRWADPENLPEYESRLQLLSLPTLCRRRSVSQILFIYKLLTGSIDSPELLSDVCLNILPCSLRNVNKTKLLYVANHRTNYGFQEPIAAASRSFNSNLNKIDFTLSPDELKDQLLKPCAV